jgi:phage shock protein PspC (stress-responsive transcriptional regulator)
MSTFLQTKVAWLGKSHWPGLLLLFVVAVLLRSVHLGSESFWCDEIIDFYTSRLDFLSMLADVRIHRGGLPLHYFIQFLMIPLGQSEVVLRMPAMLFSSLAVVTTFYLSRTLYPQKTSVAWLAALMMTLSVFQIRYAQEARFYALFILLSTTLWWRYFQALQTGRKKDWLLYFAVGVLASYAHYYTFLLLLFQGGIVFLFWLLALLKKDAVLKKFTYQQVKVVFFICMGILLMFAPALVLYTSGLGNYNSFHFSWVQVLPLLRILSGGTSTWIVLFMLAALLIPDKQQKLLNGLFILISLGCIGFVIALDAWGGYFFHVRQILFVQPLLLILMSIGIVCLLEKTLNKLKLNRLLLVLGLVVVVLVHATPLFNYWQQPIRDIPSFVFESKKTEWRQAIEYVNEKKGPAPAIICLDHMVKKSLEYYLHLQGIHNVPIVEINYDMDKMAQIVNKTHFEDYWFVDGGIFSGYQHNLKPEEQTELKEKLYHWKDFYRVQIFKFPKKDYYHRGLVEKIDIGEKSAGVYLGRGWWEDETTNPGVESLWSWADYSELILPKDNVNPVILKIRVHPIKVQTMTVAVNGEPIQELMLESGWREYSIPVDQAAWKKENNLITFTYSKSARYHKFRRARAVEWDWCEIAYEDWNLPQ